MFYILSYSSGFHIKFFKLTIVCGPWWLLVMIIPISRNSSRRLLSLPYCECLCRILVSEGFSCQVISMQNTWKSGCREKAFLTCVTAISDVKEDQIRKTCIFYMKLTDRCQERVLSEGQTIVWNFFVTCVIHCYIISVDQISIEELDVIYKIPHCVPISAHHKWNFDDLLEKMWEYLKLIRIYTKPKGQLPDYNAPVVLHADRTTVEDFCNKLHRSIIKEFKM